MLVPDTTDERDEGHCVVGYSMVRPGHVEHVGYCPLRLCWLKCLKHERKTTLATRATQMVGVQGSYSYSLI